MAPGLTVHGSEFVKVEYASISEATWKELPGVNSYSETGGEAPERDIVAFSGVAKRSGLPRVPSVEINAVYQPSHAAWRAMREAAAAGTLFRFRVTTKEEERFAINKALHTVAIPATGVVSFAGADKPDFTTGEYGVGMAIKVGGKKHVIDSISDAAPPVVKVAPAPGTPVGAAIDYKIVLPSLRRGPFSATVRIVGNVSLESEGDMTTTLTLAPRAQLPEWEIV